MAKAKFMQHKLCKKQTILASYGMSYTILLYSVYIQRYRRGLMEFSYKFELNLTAKNPILTA